MEFDYLAIAAHMLNESELPAQKSFINVGLVNRLTYLDVLLRKVGSRLMNAEVIAAEIFRWQEAHPGEDAYGA